MFQGSETGPVKNNIKKMQVVEKRNENFEQFERKKKKLQKDVMDKKNRRELVTPNHQENN